MSVRKISDDINKEDLETIPEIRKYLSRIFTILPKEIREELKSLDLSKGKKKKIKKEIAFLSKKKQKEYLAEFKELE
ncbi:MAG: hypothetical protein ACFFEN_16165 [Candidatus Thorarchaeota archaeon]